MAKNSLAYKENEKKLREQLSAQGNQFLALDDELKRVLSQNLQLHESLLAKSQELAETNNEIEVLRENL